MVMRRGERKLRIADCIDTIYVALSQWRTV
jgi:hypothetical protein